MSGSADGLSHYDEAGKARMVDVSAKAETRREAVARAFVELSDAVLKALPRIRRGIRWRWRGSRGSRRRSRRRC
jgi:hypothetical protein